MKQVILSLGVLSLFSSCVKHEKLDGNNVEFKETYFEIEEVISMEVPNDQFSWIPGLFNCMSIPLGQTIDYNAFIPTVNPNPFAHLTDEIRPKSIKMELTNIPDCDFDMLESVEIFLCDNGITDENQFILFDPSNPNNGYNAAKIGEFLNFSAGIGNTIYLDVESDAILEQFIHAGTFQTYAKMVFDKAFTEESAIIKTTMELNVRLINEE